MIKVDQEAMLNFIQSHITYKFGILKTLTTNQGIVFTVQKMVEFVSDSRIKLLTSTHIILRKIVKSKQPTKL